jgi:hypothetical protein
MIPRWMTPTEIRGAQGTGAAFACRDQIVSMALALANPPPKPSSPGGQQFNICGFARRSESVFTLAGIRSAFVFGFLFLSDRAYESASSAHRTSKRAELRIWEFNEK